MNCCLPRNPTCAAPKQPGGTHFGLRQLPTLTVGIGTDDLPCRTMLVREVTAAAAAQGMQVHIFATPCWELLDALFASRKKPDLLIFHHKAISRAIDSVARSICQRYRPVRILFLGGKIPDGDCVRDTGKEGETVLVYSSLRSLPNQAALQRCLTRDIQWLRDQGAGFQAEGGDSSP